MTHHPTGRVWVVVGLVCYSRLKQPATVRLKQPVRRSREDARKNGSSNAWRSGMRCSFHHPKTTPLWILFRILFHCITVSLSYLPRSLSYLLDCPLTHIHSTHPLAYSSPYYLPPTTSTYSYYHLLLLPPTPTTTYPYYHLLQLPPALETKRMDELLALASGGGSDTDSDVDTHAAATVGGVPGVGAAAANTATTATASTTRKPAATVTAAAAASRAIVTATTTGKTTTTTATTTTPATAARTANVPIRNPLADRGRSVGRWLLTYPLTADYPLTYPLTADLPADSPAADCSLTR